ncbi:hypothetical protein M406DRAFT_33124 [Cryphonectria parasitica EP155]|uniref:Major facilitator superfamily (MFS) profile domain-containing protein n=1 Tax=Cryphonectria parasitica (strain ATCC 38755 / EP155) TaxID=660469 RepID=A0A9P4YBR6_CRYP1|nr:uncharacterized protein M406DRAFT_33124 [Cryphonectria parasitica EP155]KAF3770557.1 hypothetical protein M406DRAFT_33124 [Cryphonectria parasitica EP155]
MASDNEVTPLLQALNGPSAVGPATEQSTQGEDGTENPDRPKGVRFAIVYGCILLGDFFVGYDTSCVTTLTPVISDEFHSIGDVGWYGIAYILALVSTILVFGQLYSIFPMKSVFTISFFLFAVGSVICFMAPSSVVFIVGRAVTGIGGAGIFSGGGIIVSQITPLHSRPIYQGITGGVECVALAFGPIVSGAIARITGSWRFSFLIIAPACLVNALAILTFVHRLPQPEHASLSTRERWARLDIVGVLLFVPGSTCLLLALQIGGSVYPWDDARVVASVVVAGVLLVLFLVAQRWAGHRAMVPLYLLRVRAVALGSLAMFFTSGSFYVFGFYLPIYFQALRGADTFTSGLMYLPSAATLAITILAAGHITSYIGYYTPLMAFGTLLSSLGAGLITTRFTLSTPPLEWIIYQIFFNLGGGAMFQQPYTAIQAVLPDKNVPTAIVVLSFVQELGGFMALAVAQAVFIGTLLRRLKSLGLGLTARDVLDMGALDLIEAVPEAMRGLVKEAYMDSIREVFVVGLVCTCCTIVSLGIPWRSVKEDKDKAAESDE